MRFMKHKSILSLLVLVVLLAPPAHAERINLMLTMTGSPIRIAAQSTKVNRLFVQARHGNVGLVTVMLGVSTRVACNVSATNPSQISAELGPGDSLHPGQSLSDPQGATGDSPADFEDLALACVQGTSGDQVIVSAWHRN
jgi:hypothetical protein